MRACPQPLRIAGLLLALLVPTAATGASAHMAGAPVVPPPPTAYLVQPEADQAATTVRNGYFWLAASPGRTRTVRVVVKNTGSAPLRLRSYPVDSIQEPTGGIDYGTWQTPRTRVGTWMRLSPATMTLAPGQTRRVTATIHVPRGTGAGVHVGGLAVENAQVQRRGQGSHVLIDVHYRRVIAVVLEAPGMLRTAAHVKDVTLATAAPGSRAVVALRNSGNVLLKGTGTLAVTGKGRRTVVMPFTLDTVLPAAIDRVAVLLPALSLQPGAYAVGVRVRSSAGAALIVWHGSVVVARPAVPTPPPHVTLPPVQALVHTAQSTSLLWVILGGLGVVLILGLGIGLGASVGRRRGQTHG